MLSADDADALRAAMPARRLSSGAAACGGDPAVENDSQAINKNEWGLERNVNDTLDPNVCCCVLFGGICYSSTRVSDLTRAYLRGRIHIARAGGARHRVQRNIGDRSQSARVLNDQCQKKS
jgi:hypothetical protein